MCVNLYCMFACRRDKPMWTRLSTSRTEELWICPTSPIMGNRLRWENHFNQQSIPSISCHKMLWTEQDLYDLHVNFPDWILTSPGPFPQPTYVNPLVAVRFHLVREKRAKVQCRVVSDKISYENIHDPYEGKVVFYLRALKWGTEIFLCCVVVTQ